MGKQSNDISEGEIICLDCKRNYILANDNLSCELVSLDDFNENCKSYWIIDEDQTVCNKCEDGFVLSEDLLICNGECAIAGCATCQIQDTQTLCFSCPEELLLYIIKISYL